MIKVTKVPDFKKTFKFLEKINDHDPKPILEKYGALGVSALARATPLLATALAALVGHRTLLVAPDRCGSRPTR